MAELRGFKISVSKQRGFMNIVVVVSQTVAWRSSHLPLGSQASWKTQPGSAVPKVLQRVSSGLLTSSGSTSPFGATLYQVGMLHVISCDSS